MKLHRPHWRKMTWVLVAWSAFNLIWIIAGTNSAQQKCDPHYQNACDAGTAIGAGLIFGLWFMGFVVLALIWFMTRPHNK